MFSRNVGLAPVGLRPCVPRYRIFLRGVGGTQVPLSKEGLEFHGISERRFNNWFGSLPPGGLMGPGRGAGIALRVDRIFAPPGPGTYTLLAEMDYSFTDGGNRRVVAAPLTLSLGPAAAGRSAQGWASRPEPAIAGPTPRGAFRTEMDDGTVWSDLASMAGQPRRGCVLLASLSPDASRGPHVVASLLRVTARTGTGAADFIPKLGSNATDYDIIVRDPAGKPLPMIDPAWKCAPRPAAR